LQNYLGVFGAIGLTQLEWVVPNSPELLESWVIISGPGVRSGDPNAVAYGGVFTHEFGHAVNLAHSTVNGSLIRDLNPSQPRDCGSPFAGVPPHNKHI